MRRIFVSLVLLTARLAGGRQHVDARKVGAIARDEARPVFADAHRRADGAAGVDEQLDRCRDAQQGSDLVERRGAETAFVVAVIVTTGTSALGRANANAVLPELRRTEPSADISRSSSCVMDRPGGRAV
jgi:hypothetical protein